MSHIKRIHNHSSHNVGKERQLDNKRKAPDVECGRNGNSVGPRCSMEFQMSHNRFKQCENIAEVQFGCGHLICGTCFETCKRSNTKKIGVYKCPFCGYRTWKNEIKPIKSIGEGEKRTDCETQLFYEQENQKVTPNLPSSTHTKQCDVKTCGSSVVAITLNCRHKFCASCLCRLHKPVVVLQDYCCIRCHICKDEMMWYTCEEIQKKAQENGETFSLIGMQSTGMADANIDIDFYFEMEEFCIEWKYTGHIRPQFSITAYDIVNKTRNPDKTVPSHNKTGVYTYKYGISTGKYIFKLTSYRHDKEDAYPIWIGPIERLKDKAPSMDGKLQITENGSNFVDLSWDCVIPPKYVNIYKYIVQMKTDDGCWRDYQSVNFPTSECRITDLEKGHRYHFRITVKTSIGDGIENGTIETYITTSENIDEPEKPDTVEVKLVSQTDIQVSWYQCLTKPFQTVKEFVIENRSFGTYSWDVVKTVTNDPNAYWQNCIIPDLMEETTYYFRVKSRNEKGESEGACSKAIKTEKKEKQEMIPEKMEEEKDFGKEDETGKICSGCLKLVKVLETQLNCNHKFCEGCTTKRLENVFVSENGIDYIFYWECNSKDCNEMTEEKHVKVIGNTFTKSLIQEKRKHWLEEKKDIGDIDQKQTCQFENVNDNELNQSSDVSVIRGLPNVGMTCYANCIFQILGQTPDLMDHLEVVLNDFGIERDKSVSGQLLKLLEEINGLATNQFRRVVDFDTVIRLVDTVCSKDESFIRGEQADSHSFMMTLFNAIKEETKKSQGTTKDHKSQANSKDNLVNRKKMSQATLHEGCSNGDENMFQGPLDLFEGYMYNKLTCKKCSNVEESEQQMFYSLLIPVEESLFTSSWTLADGIKTLLKKEYFDMNDLPCGKCGKKDKDFFDSSITKQQMFAKLPNVLILQLGKFKQVRSSLTKMNQKVKYPFTLDMDDKLKKSTYNLYGVALHVGTLKYGGHYAAYVKRHVECKTDTGNDVWYYCSDSVINMVPSEKVLNDNRACILFYRRIL